MGTEPQRLKFVTDYLLGRLNPEDRDRFEEEYFTDNDVYIELLETEDRLISSYLQGKLPPHERQLFEQFYLTNPCNQQKVELVSILNQREMQESVRGKSEAATNHISSWPFSLLSFFSGWPISKPLAVVALLILIGVFVLPVREFFTTKAPPEAAIMSSQTPPLQPVGNAGESREREIVRLFLEPGTQRSGSNPSPVAHKELETRIIELNLKLAGYVYPKYAGRLQRIDEGRREIERNDSLLPEPREDHKIVIWKLGATKLPDGDYQVELMGMKPDGDPGDMNAYEFNVRTR
jgi:hypothetical protein